MVEEPDKSIYYDADRALGHDPDRGIEVVSCSDVDETNRPHGPTLDLARALRKMVMRAVLGKVALADSERENEKTSTESERDQSQSQGQTDQTVQNQSGGGAPPAADAAQFTEAGVSTFGGTDVDDASLLGDGAASIGFDRAPNKASGIPRGLVEEAGYSVQNTSYV